MLAERTRIGRYCVFCRGDVVVLVRSDGSPMNCWVSLQYSVDLQRVPLASGEVPNILGWLAVRSRLIEE